MHQCSICVVFNSVTFIAVKSFFCFCRKRGCHSDLLANMWVEIGLWCWPSFHELHVSLACPVSFCVVTSSFATRVLFLCKIFHIYTFMVITFAPNYAVGCIYIKLCEKTCVGTSHAVWLKLDVIYIVYVIFLPCALSTSSYNPFNACVFNIVFNIILTVRRWPLPFSCLLHIYIDPCFLLCRHHISVFTSASMQSGVYHVRHHRTSDILWGLPSLFVDSHSYCFHPSIIAHVLFNLFCIFSQCPTPIPANWTLRIFLGCFQSLLRMCSRHSYCILHIRGFGNVTQNAVQDILFVPILLFVLVFQLVPHCCNHSFIRHCTYFSCFRRPKLFSVS